MLKIKDSVDLKELEKFGFDSYILKNIGSKYHNVREYLYFDKSIGWYLIIFESDRLIQIQKDELNYKDAPYSNLFVEKLYDLIKANMVEKVEE